MEPTLIPGDQVLVNKLILGGRLINYFSQSDSVLKVVGRLPRMRKPRRNDILVFNFPLNENWTKLSFCGDIFLMKRCIGLPGDTLSIRRGVYRVKGYKGSLGLINKQQMQLSTPLTILQEHGMYETFPHDSIMNWNIIYFGPLYIPQKGRTITLNRDNYALYKTYIEYETGKQCQWNKQKATIGKEVFNQYTFKENYYFMAGDNCLNSLDSRFFGLIPESFIAGKAVLIWSSINKITKEIIWNRIGIQL